MDKIISINKVCYRTFTKKENCIYTMYIEEDSDYIIYSIGKSPVMHPVKAIRYMFMKRSI